MAKISIVDNDQENVDSITAILQSGGHTCSVFTESSSFMDALKKKRADMIIIGVDLDGSDGRELSRFLQVESPFKSIPVMLTSPFYHTEAEIRSFYCDDLVSTPLDAALFATSFEALLAKSVKQVENA